MPLIEGIVTVSSPDFISGAMIPPEYKSLGCDEANLNPAISWTITNGLIKAHIASFSLEVMDMDTPGSSSLGKALHWSVDNILPSYLVAGAGVALDTINILDNWIWPGDSVINATDYTGDNANGWNGPCPAALPHNYAIVITAHINVVDQPAIGATVVSNSYLFQDQPSNVSTEIGTSSCGDDGCPPGSVLDGSNCNTTSNSFSGPSLVVTAAVEILCCYLIENCKDPEDVYYIQFDASPGASLYINAVYELAGSLVFQELGGNKCFTLVNEVVCTTPDVTGVTVLASHGEESCNLCNSCLKIESCTTEGTFLYIRLPVGDAPLVVDNIYEFVGLTGCYSFVAIDTENCDSAIDDVIIATDHATANCDICVPCHEFQECDQEVTEWLAALGYIYVNPNTGSPCSITIDDAVINEVSIISAPVNLSSDGTVPEEEVFANPLVDAINNYTSEPNYTAYKPVPAGDTIYVSAEVSEGATPNSFILTIPSSNNIGGVTVADGLPMNTVQAGVSGTHMQVRLADGETVPAVGNIQELGGSSLIENKCFTYIGEATCDGDEDFVDLTIAKDYECDNCQVCDPYYTLEPCVEPACEDIVTDWLSALGYMAVAPDVNGIGASCTVDSITVDGINLLSQTHALTSDGTATQDLEFSDAVWQDLHSYNSAPYDFQIYQYWSYTPKSRIKLESVAKTVGAFLNGVSPVITVSNPVNVETRADVIGSLRAGAPQITEPVDCDECEQVFFVGVIATAEVRVNTDDNPDGSFDSLTVDGVEIMSGSVPTSANEFTFITDIIDNINAYTSSPNYNASPSDNGFLVEAAAVGVFANGLALLESITSADGWSVNIYDDMGDEDEGADVITNSHCAASNIRWNRTDEPLDPTKIYVFDFAPEKCYRPTLQFPDCDQDLETYGTANIISENDTCSPCADPCYKITDCTTAAILATSNEDLSGYVGKIIEWVNGDIDSGDQITYYGLVEEYICIDEVYPMIDNPEVVECYNSCENAQLVVKVPEEVFTQRSVQPGSSVPNCEN